MRAAAAIGRRAGAGPAAGHRGAVVTGGGGGLGTAIGHELAAMGYRVHLADVDRSAAERAAALIGPAASAAAVDVTDAAACRRLAAEVAAADGLALWVNNAGILHTGPAWEQPAEQTAALFAVNAHGTIHGTDAALAMMRPAGRGHVCNVVSLAGLVAPPGETVYAASKHAALAYTLGTAQDLRLAGEDGIAVSAICPDGVWSPMLHDRVDDPQAALSWSGVLLSPERVAAVVADVVRRPRAVVSIPRWRGGVARLAATLPGPARRLAPAITAQARRKQDRFRRRLAAGTAPVALTRRRPPDRRP